MTTKRPLELERVVWSRRPLAGKVRRDERCHIMTGGDRLTGLVQVRFQDGTVAIVPTRALRAPKSRIEQTTIVAGELVVHSPGAVMGFEFLSTFDEEANG